LIGPHRYVTQRSHIPPEVQKSFSGRFSTDDERTRVLGKIIDEVGLKRTMKANARLKKQSHKAGVKPKRVFPEHRAAASKKSAPSQQARELVKRHNQRDMDNRSTSMRPNLEHTALTEHAFGKP
jgi:hypothetical protein